MLETIVEWLVLNWDSLTVGILLVVIIYGGSRPNPWWVFGREYQEERSEKLQYKDIAFDLSGIASKALDVAEEEKSKQ